MPKNLENESQSQGITEPGGAPASGRSRRPTAKLQAMQDDREQEKTAQKRDAQVKAKQREERIRKRDQATKAAQFDPHKAQSPQAQRMDADLEAPSIATVDKAFESRAAGGLPCPLTRASLATPLGTLVVRKGNIPPASSLPKAQQTMPAQHVRVCEPVESMKLSTFTLNEMAVHKRARAPTPFNGKETDGYTRAGVGSNKHAHDLEEDFDSPPFTQKKRVCHVILSDNDDLLAGETVAQDMKSPASNGVGEMAETECKPSHDLGKQANPQARPKVHDYSKESQKVIGTAIEFYHALLLSENPFPDPNEELNWVKKVFDASRIYHKLPNVELDAGKIKIITARGSHLRGQFKSRAKAIVAPSYGFEVGDGVATKEKNRKLATELKTKLAFTFRELHPCRAGIYKNNVIQHIINDILFKKKANEGIKWAEYYNPFPWVGFALTFTAIECSLDEWTTGKYESIHFKEDEYKSLYKQHLKTLNYFDDQTKKQGILPKILQDVFDIGKSNTGVKDDLELSTNVIVITDDIIEDAIKEFGEEVGQPEINEIEEEPASEEQSGWWLKPDGQFEQGGHSEDEIESDEGSTMDSE